MMSCGDLCWLTLSKSSISGKIKDDVESDRKCLREEISPVENQSVSSTEL